MTGFFFNLPPKADIPLPTQFQPLVAIDALARSGLSPFAPLAVILDQRCAPQRDADLHYLSFSLLCPINELRGARWGSAWDAGAQT